MPVLVEPSLHLRTVLFVVLLLTQPPAPRPACSNGMGRHTFWFMRHVSTPYAISFQIFMALPFIYELRQLLDWACTPTTLT